MVGFLNSLPEGGKKVIVVIAAALGPVLIIVGKVIYAIDTIMTLMPKIAAAINTAKTAFSAFSVVLVAKPILAAAMALVRAVIS